MWKTCVSFKRTKHLRAKERTASGTGAIQRGQGPTASGSTASNNAESLVGGSGLASALRAATRPTPTVRYLPGQRLLRNAAISQQTLWQQAASRSVPPSTRSRCKLMQAWSAAGSAMEQALENAATDKQAPPRSRLGQGARRANLSGNHEIRRSLGGPLRHRCYASASALGKSRWL